MFRVKLCEFLVGQVPPRVCRFVLQPGMLPEDARLANDLMALRHNAAALEDAANMHQAADFADIVLLVDGRCFRWSCLVNCPLHVQCISGCMTTYVIYASRHQSSGCCILKQPWVAVLEQCAQ